jgi:SOS-response transcriptional repressor LexA
MGPVSFANLSCKREVSMAISIEVSEPVENFPWLTEAALTAATEVIKNTYRNLMTRGHKGCFIYCTDQEPREYFQQIASRQLERAKPYQGYAPIFDLEIAAGSFSDQQFLENAGHFDDSEWVQLPEHINTTQGMFVTRVVGESMNKRIINGSWCLFKANPGGSRNGKIVLVQHRDIEDPDHGGTYTVKTYHSEKIEEDGVLVNQRIVFKPETNAYGYSPIIIEDDCEELVVVGEWLSTL